MVHQVKVLATNPEVLTLIHGTYIVERTDSPKVFFNLQTCIHPSIHINVFFKRTLLFPVYTDTTSILEGISSSLCISESSRFLGGRSKVAKKLWLSLTDPKEPPFLNSTTKHSLKKCPSLISFSALRNTRPAQGGRGKQLSDCDKPDLCTKF